MIKMSGKKINGAHRVSYEIFKGKIPEGLFVCHSCDVKRCVNPDHLWVGTQQDNMMDHLKKGLAKGASKTHCIRGHDLNNSANISQAPSIKSRGLRRCLPCRREASRLKYQLSVRR